MTLISQTETHLRMIGPTSMVGLNVFDVHGFKPRYSRTFSKSRGHVSLVFLLANSATLFFSIIFVGGIFVPFHTGKSISLPSF